MPSPTRSLAQVQADIKARLQRHPEFAGIQILTERAKDFAAAVDLALGGLDPDHKAGIFLTVATPTLVCDRPEIPGPLVTLAVAVTVSENIVQNTGDAGSRVPCSDMALDVLRALSGYVPPNCSKPLLSANAPVRVVADPFDDDRLCYLVSLTTEFCLTPLRLENEGAFVKG
jgi:hypothetical protein